MYQQELDLTVYNLDCDVQRQKPLDRHTKKHHFCQAS